METTPLNLSPSEAAQVIGLSRAEIYRLINAGRLKTWKYGRRTLIAYTEVVRLNEELKAEGSQEGRAEAS